MESMPHNLTALTAMPCCMSCMQSIKATHDLKGPHLEEVDKEVGVLLKVQGDGIVVDLRVGHLDGHVLELHMLPGRGRVCHHD